MATFRSSSTVASGSSPSALTATKPAGVANNDLLLAFVTISADQTITSTPEGWLLVSEKNTGTASGDVRHAVYRKIANDEPSGWTWGWSAGADAAIVVLAYYDINTTDPIDVTGHRLMGSTTTQTAPSVTPSATNTTTVIAYAVNPYANINTTFTTPSGWTDRGEADPGTGTTNRAVLKVFDKDVASGATGDQSTTINNNAKGVAFTVTIRGSAATPQTISVQPMRAVTPAAGGFMIGWHDKNGVSGTNGMTDMEDLLQTRFPVVRLYHRPDDWPNVSNQVASLTADKRLVVSSHKPPKRAGSWIEIHRGDWDAQILAIAEEYKALAPKEVVVIFHHEPHDQTSDHQAAKTPYHGTMRDFVKAYRHWASIFRSIDADNVKLGYSAVDSWANDYPDDKLWPGADVVDVVCHDIYNWGSYKGGWEDPAEQFAEAVAMAKSVNRPLLVAEVGVHPSEGSHSRAQWFRDLATYVTTDPDARTYFIGMCYYHVDNHDGSGHYWRFVQGPTAGNDKQGFIDSISNNSHFKEYPFPVSLTGAAAPDEESGEQNPSGGTPPKVSGTDWKLKETVDGITIGEVSGVAASPKGGWWGIRDSGNEDSLFWFTQNSRGIFSSRQIPITGGDNRDWEDCFYTTEGSQGYVWILDNRDGNSTGDAPKRITKVVEPANPATASSTTIAATYHFKFPNDAPVPCRQSGSTSIQNCEAFAMFKGVIYAVQKTDADQAYVYRVGIPGTDISTSEGSPTTATYVGTIGHHCPSSFAISADGTHVITVSHNRIKVWKGKGDTIQSLLTGKNTKVWEKSWSGVHNLEGADWFPYQTSDFLAVAENRNTVDGDVVAGTVYGSGIPSRTAFGNMTVTMATGPMLVTEVGGIASPADYNPADEEDGIEFGEMTAYMAPPSTGDPLEFAIYGVSFYGTARYGLPPAVDFSLAYFAADPDGYDTIRVVWQHPTGTWDRLKLVRGAYGFPTDEIDGTLLVEAAVDSATGTALGLPIDPQGYVDSGVKSKRFYYYSIFLRVVATGAWIRAGDAVALMPHNYDSSQRLLDLIPAVYRDNDFYLSQNTGVGELESFLQAIGYETDTLRTELESLLWVFDPTKMSGGLLPRLAAQLGFPYESELGMLLVRRQLLNAVYLYKMKGTRLGIEGAVSVLTGWAPTITVAGPNDLDVVVAADRVNRVVNPSAETNNSNWTATNGAVTRATTQFRYGAASFQLTISANGDASMVSANMPVTAGQTYTGSVYNFKASGTPRSIRTDLRWLDAGASPVASVQGTPVTQALGSWGNRPYVTGTAPENATQVALVANVLGGGASETQFFDGALFEQGSQLQPYFDADVGTPGSDYLWEGTAHLSRSHYYHRRAMKNSRMLIRLGDFLPIGTTFSVLFAQGV